MVGRSLRSKVRRGWHQFRQRHLDDFVFIRINKAGGTSVKRALRLTLKHQTALEMIE